MAVVHLVDFPLVHYFKRKIGNFIKVLELIFDKFTDFKYVKLIFEDNGETTEINSFLSLLATNLEFKVAFAFAIGGLNWISFNTGFAFGQVGGIISSLQKKEDGLDFTDGQISMIATIFTAMLLLGYGLAAVAADKLGRRWPFIVFYISNIINWIILYHATEFYQFMISRIIAGTSVGGHMLLYIFIATEYTSPKTRAFYLNMIKDAFPAFGTALAHAICTVLHWRTVALLNIVFNILGIALPYFWVESPHWLASKGKFEDCELSFWKLHENTANSERELQLLIKFERNKLLKANEIKCKSTIKKLLRAFKLKYFWRLIILNIFINGYMVAAGKIVFSILASVIVEEITGTSDVLLFTLLVDGFFVLGSCLSCFLIRKSSMRTLLFSTGFTAILILVLFSACYYCRNGRNYFNWINVTLLALYFIIINAGPCPVLEVILSEMFPLELKMYAFFITSFTLISFLTLSVVLLPITVSSIGYHGLFLLYATIMLISLGFIGLKLPETKGKTLQEIETYFKTNNFNVDEILNSELTNALL